MATVPGVPQPSVSPSAQPAPFESINAPAEAFRANVVGAGLSELGAQAQRTSDVQSQFALQLQTLNNKVAADSATNTFLTSADKLRAEFQANNQGEKAAPNLDKFYTAVDTLRNQAGAGLSPLAQADFDAASRRYNGIVKGDVTGWAIGQQKQSALRGSDARMEGAAALGASHPDDPAILDTVRKTIFAETQWQQRELGLPDEVSAQLFHKQMGGVWASAIKQAYDGGNLHKANTLLDTHKDDMTAEQITAVSGALRVANHADTIQSLADAMVHGGTAGGVDPTWANPQATLASLLGGRVTITSALRTPEHNAEVHGVPNSYHLTNQAVDFIPPHGVTMEQAVAAIRASGAPTAELLNEGNHVHVAWKAGSAQSFPALGFTPQTDPDAYVANGDAAIYQHTSSLALGAADKQAVFAAAHQRLMINAQQLRAQQGAQYDTLAKAVNDQAIDDPTALQRLHPDIWANLPAKYQNALLADVHNQGAMITPQRQSNIAEVTGLYAQVATNPAPFLNEDIRGKDLPMSVKTRFLSEQQRILHGGKAPNTVSASILNSTQGQATVTALRLNPSLSDPHYLQFTGALEDEVEHFQAKEPGKVPQPTDIARMLSNVSATRGTNWGASPGFEVPNSERPALKAALAKQGIIQPSEYDYARLYAHAMRSAPRAR